MNMYFDRFDICEAWYCFLAEYHEGAMSKRYARLCKLLTYFKPRPSLSVESLNDNAREIYQNLVYRMYQKGEIVTNSMPRV